ncbi:MAG: adenylosuccinate lyase, partial [Gemmatimonadetes bacterium]|nr:adenylosuccinate lyase [Gemmatimonadota bacterium]
QWLERTLDDSANRRLSIPDAYLTTDGMLVLAENVTDGLVVHTAMIERRLAEELPFMATESVLMAATRGGGDRQELHERIRQHAHAAAARLKAGHTDNDLTARIAADTAFGLDADAVGALMDPRAFVGRAPEQVDAFVADEVEPELERWSDLLAARPAPTADVRV